MTVRDDVSEVLVRYATGIDRRDWTVLRSCFTDDCDADYGDIGHWRSGDEITEWMRVSHEPAGPSLHRITNVVVDQTGRDRASARSYVDAVVLGPGNTGGAHALGFYDDGLVRGDDGWRISSRRYTMVRLESLGAGMAL